MNRISSPVLFSLVGLGTLLVIYLFYTMVIQPKQEEITLRQTEKESRQQTLSQYQANAAALPALRDTVAKLENDRGKFIRALPLTADFSRILEQIRGTVASNNAQLKTLNFSASANSELPAGVKPININLSIEGEYAKQFQILRALETQSRFANVNSVALSAAGDALTNNPKLNGTMDIVVYTFDPALVAPSSDSATTESAPTGGR